MAEVPLALVFEPTEEEFRLGPLSYIDKIRPEAEKFGVVKIRPPATWQPPFAIDAEKFVFTPRIQRLNELEGRSRIRLNFTESIVKFWRLQGVTVKLPTIEGRSIDLFDLHKTVKSAGGFELVCLHKKWAQVAVLMKVKKHQGTTLRNQYEKILLPYDIHLSGLALEHTQKSSPAKIQPLKTPEKQRRRSRYQTAQEFPQTCVPVDMNSTKELRRLQFYGAGPKLAGMPEFLSGDREDIRDALSSGKNSAEPDSSDVGSEAEEGGSETSSQSSRSKTKWRNRRAALATVKCRICDSDEKNCRLLLCDVCSDSFHTYCLLPPMTAIPKGEWRCPKCVTDEVSKPQDPYGFDEGIRSYSLSSFGEMADQFKTDYFGQPCHNVEGPQVAREYWRLVSSESDHFQVEYGADLFTDEVGSGFPKLSDPKLLPDDQIYAKSPWNLNNLPVLKNSVLRHIATDISGMKIPWVYVGMCFSTFCWHTEDHWSYSINYLHWGEPKIWYGVSGLEAEKFESAMKEIVPDLFKSQPDLLHHLVTIMNPEVLMDKGVKIHRVHQCAGEFVVTFPRAYHAGFNEGYNFAEAVNFCPPDWLSYGRRCVDAYAEVKRLTVFSHDEVSCKMASVVTELDVTLANAAYRDMREMAERERDLRRQMMEMGVKAAERIFFEVLHDDERQCAACKTTLFMSAISCPCSAKKLACLRHARDLCACDAAKFSLKYRYSLDELQQMMSGLKIRAESYGSWLDRVKLAMNKPEENKIALSDFRRLAEEAKDLKIPACESLEWLVNSVKHAERCIGIADQLVAHKIRTRNRQNGVVNFSSKLLMDEVVAFYQTILKLPCAIPQAESIRKFIETVKDFRATASDLLAAVPNRQLTGQLIVDLEDKFDVGVSLDLQLPELPRLKEELDRTKWLWAVELATGASRPTTSALFDCKAELKEDDDDDVEVIADRPSLEKLRGLMVEGVGIPHSAQVEMSLAKLQSLLTAAEAGEDQTRLLQNLRQSRAQVAVKRSATEVSSLKSPQRRRKRPAPPLPAAGPIGSRKTVKNDSSSDEDTGDDSKEFCSAPACLRPTGKDIGWIQCEGLCEGWYHQQCVGIEALEADSLAQYVCFRCSHDGFDANL